MSFKKIIKPTFALVLTLVCSTSFAKIDGVVKFVVKNDTHNIIEISGTCHTNSTQINPNDYVDIGCANGTQLFLNHLNATKQTDSQLQFNHYVTPTYSYFMQAYEKGLQLNYKVIDAKGNTYNLKTPMPQGVSQIYSDDHDGGAEDKLHGNIFTIYVDNSSN